MSKTEFDQYLALLSGLLRLDAAQREEIASELRDHLEERLAELLSQGVPRTKAIEMALEEFGDAAGLAGDFARIFRQQRRRWMMRMTLRTAAGLAALVVLATAFWPPGRPGPAPPQLVAQDDVPETAADRPLQLPVRQGDASEVDQKLSRRIDIDFIELPFHDALADLCLQADLQFYIKTRYLDDHGVDVGSPVTLELEQVSVEMALDLILEQMELTYIIRDGIVLVTTEEDLENVAEVRVYNCRDLLASNILEGGHGVEAGGLYEPAANVQPSFDPYGTPPRNTSPRNTRKKPAKSKSDPTAREATKSSLRVVPQDILAQFGGGGMGGGGMGVPATGPSSREDQLMDLITTSVQPDSWDVVGGPGTIAEFDGLIVIRHNPHVHRKVERVLEMLREASAQQPWAPGVPRLATAPAYGVEG